MYKSDLCKCGHPRAIHGVEGTSYEICWGFGVLNPNCLNKCKKFDLDNLKYLEQLYESRT